MQIVRDLAGYTLGRSDLLRRAMSKKKGDVMQKEQKPERIRPAGHRREDPLPSLP